MLTRPSKHVARIAGVVLVVAVIAAAATASLRSQTTTYDLLIRGGQVIDGSGNPWFYADIAVKDGRIAAVGAMPNATATRVISAAGHIVTPGFIDMHSHADGGLATMELRHSPNMVAQGITLSVVNQDGRSPRPIRDQKALYEKQGIGTNAALLVGHGTVRTRVMGNQRDNQVATDADIQAMQKLVDEGMADGAFGLSSGLEYDPGRYSETREVVALTRMVKPYGGFYISHERSEGADPMWKVKSDPTPFVSLIEAVNETITIGRETGVPVVASHLKAKGASYWGSSQVADAAHSRSARAGDPSLRGSVSVRDLRHRRQHGADSRLGARAAGTGHRRSARPRGRGGADSRRPSSSAWDSTTTCARSGWTSRTRSIGAAARHASSSLTTPMRSTSRSRCSSWRTT